MLISAERVNGRTFQFVIPGGPPPKRRATPTNNPARGPSLRGDSEQVGHFPKTEYITDLEFDWSKGVKDTGNQHDPMREVPSHPQCPVSQTIPTDHNESQQDRTPQQASCDPYEPETEQQVFEDTDNSDVFESDQEDDEEGNEQQQLQPSNKPQVVHS